MKSTLIALSVVLATAAAPALALGVPMGDLTPTLTFPDQHPSDQVSQEKTSPRN
ncbi:hypothetical protein SL1157_2087 [Ruegeria lacuscaerulensis ITI-1157]|nr:hypothetical protein SL1157_2087 [Ruegeria lacuscaerulensis ITI-1157]SHI93725.1 hypothetical protein SAMN05444404_1038 [Ruegeria lacuscaerulensis ITI-1157]